MPLRAQSSAPVEGRGTNYDPPPVPISKPSDPSPAPDTAADQPLISLRELDWKDKLTWVKFALLVGSILLALRAFRQMKEDEADYDEE